MHFWRDEGNWFYEFSRAVLEKRAILRFQGYFEVTLGINGVQFLNSVKIKDKFRVLSLRRHQKISAFRPRKYLICARKTGEIVVDTLNKRGCVKAQIMELCQPSIKENTKIPRRSRKNSSGDAYWCVARTWSRSYRQNWSWQPIYYNIAEEAVKNHK